MNEHVKERSLSNPLNYEPETREMKTTIRDEVVSILILITTLIVVLWLTSFVEWK